MLASLTKPRPYGSAASATGFDRILHRGLPKSATCVGDSASGGPRTVRGPNKRTIKPLTSWPMGRMGLIPVNTTTCYTYPLPAVLLVLR